VATPALARQLKENHNDALAMVRSAGESRTLSMLKKAQEDLEERLADTLTRNNEGSFTAVQLRSTLEQIKQVIAGVQHGIQQTVLGQVNSSSHAAISGTLRYLNAAEKKFRGVSQPLALNEARLFDNVASGVNSSILSRLSAGPVHPAGAGILQRYGTATLRHFEDVLQKGVLTRSSQEDMAKKLREQSDFLKAAPAHWATRIVRTETMGVYNRANWETHREADKELGDMTKILVATFDDRTGADSFAVHGQIRRPEEAFQSWFGLYQHPPNRPNDREVTVPHRICWPLPDHLRWRTDAEILARWKFEGRKGPPPGRPKMTTVELSKFGVEQPPPIETPPEETPEQAPEQTGTRVPPKLVPGLEPDTKKYADNPPKPTKGLDENGDPIDADLPLEPDLGDSKKMGINYGVMELNRLRSVFGKVDASDLFLETPETGHQEELAKHDIDALLRRAKALGDKRVSREDINLGKDTRKVDRDAIHDAIKNPDPKARPVLFRWKGRYFIQGSDAPVAMANYLTPGNDRVYNVVDLDAAKAGRESQTPKGFAKTLVRALAKPETRGNEAREGTRAYLQKAMGLGESMDIVPGMRDMGTILISNQANMKGAAGMHDWSGKVVLESSVNNKAARELSHLAEHGAPSTWTANDSYKYDSIRVILHEELHGFSGNRAPAYQGAGIGIEEAQTEVLARKATRELLGDSTPVGGLFSLPKYTQHSWGSDYAPGHGSYEEYISTVLKVVGEAHGDTLESHAEAPKRMEQAFLKVVRSREEFKKPEDQIRAFVKALDAPPRDPSEVPNDTKAKHAKDLVTTLTSRLELSVKRQRG
jgi:hypothetical protein